MLPCQYDLSPKICSNCLTILSFKQRRNKFCSHSCAAQKNNLGIQRHGRTPIACLSCGSLTKNNKYCSNTCQQIHEFETITAPSIIEGKISDRKVLRSFLIKRDGYQCVRCQLSEWMGEPIPLCLDHTDGDPSNHKPENLRLLCQNCHGLTPTFAGRNRGNGRKSRGIA
jgi:hypothetical protein